jgi:alanine dehydrogenase
MVKEMKPGSVIVDVAVDQGGCVETIRPTSHSEPTYTVHDIVHYGVPNIPGAVPRTSTYGLSNVTLPYALRLANNGFRRAIADDAALAKGVNTHAGHITYPAVADAFGLSCRPVSDLL